MSAGFEPGTLIGGKYLVERVLGAGGMGVVLAARHRTLRQVVAIKLLLPDARVSTTAVARFIREARAAAALRSGHVVRVLDVDQLSDGMPFMVMEYLDGCDLAALLKKGGPLSVARAVGYVRQACVALDEAHRVGVVHRDLKPANLLLTKRSDGADLIKLVDFGISKLSDGTDMEGSLTRTSALMGSPLYMSPEQIRDAKSVDARTDIWSLGVILWELVIGRTPFEAETLPALSVKIATEPLPDPNSARPGLPPALADCLRRCLDKDPDRRYQSASELNAALAPFDGDGSASAAATIDDVPSYPLHAVLPASVAPSLPATAPGWGTTRSPQQNRRSRVWGAAALTVAAVTLGVAGLLLSSLPRVAVGLSRGLATHAAGQRATLPTLTASEVGAPASPSASSRTTSTERARTPSAREPKALLPAKPGAKPAETCKPGLVWDGKRCERPMADDI
ncbi:MAG: serine/threonine-protein kinase [Polyangiaceae bacterium]